MSSISTNESQPQLPVRSFDDTLIKCWELSIPQQQLFWQKGACCHDSSNFRKREGLSFLPVASLRLFPFVPLALFWMPWTWKRWRFCMGTLLDVWLRTCTFWFSLPLEKLHRLAYSHFYMYLRTRNRLRGLFSAVWGQSAALRCHFGTIW